MATGNGRLRGPNTLYGISLLHKDVGSTSPVSHGFLTPHFSHAARTRRFGDGLFPLHSPLLRESWLVSFPPLSDMLKFSG